MLIIAAAATIASAPPDPAIVALTRCVHSAEPSPVDPGPTIAPPPGLLDDQAKVVAIAGRAGAFAYQGTRGLSCGVALYGKVPAAMRREIEAIVASVAGWHPFKPARRAALRGRAMGWGDPGNPTMYGAILYERRPSAAAPTIDVLRYAVLVP